MLLSLRCVDRRNKNIKAAYNFFSSLGCHVTLEHPAKSGWWSKVSDANNKWSGWIYLPEWLEYALPELSGTALNCELANLLIIWLNNEVCPVRFTLKGIDTNNAIFHAPELKTFYDDELLLKVQGQSFIVWLEWVDKNIFHYDDIKQLIDFNKVKLKLIFLYGRTKLSLSELCKIDIGDILLVEKREYKIIYLGKVMSYFDINDNFSSLKLAPSDSDDTLDNNESEKRKLQDINVTRTTQFDRKDSVIKDINHLPVVLTFQLCTIEATLEEVTQYKFDDIITLPENVINNIDILVNGALSGKGELVMVSNQIGVEVKEWFVGGNDGF